MAGKPSSVSTEEEQLAWLSLKLLPDLGNRSLLRLIRHFGGASAVLRADASTLAAVPELRPRAARIVLSKAFIRPPELERKTLRELGIELVSLHDGRYPENLKTIPDPPAVLFVKGSLQPRDLVAVAVVGSRAASPNGMIFTQRLCEELAESGVTIVSGLAVGIDSAAHRGALKAGGRTLAVLGCGVDVPYPAGSLKLRREIPGNGALVSEFPLETKPAPGHFPQRNRIISGLALGVVVVEAAHRSGSLITARLALEQGREVFAVPGMARHYRSVGVHRLLREGAKLVESAEDILEEIRPLVRRSSTTEPSAQPSQPCPKLLPEEDELLRHLDREPKHVDELCRTLQWPVSRVMSILLALELKGRVQELPGKHFVANNIRNRDA